MFYYKGGINMTKKEFKKKCKEEKTTSYKLMLFGGIISIVALIIALVTFFIIEEFYLQIVSFVIAGIFAVIGIILDLAGEIILAKNYKEYNK